MTEKLDTKAPLSNKDVLLLLMDHFMKLTLQNNTYQRELITENNAQKRNLINEIIEFAIQCLCAKIVKLKDSYEKQAFTHSQKLKDLELKTEITCEYLEHVFYNHISNVSQSLSHLKSHIEYVQAAPPCLPSKESHL